MHAVTHAGIRDRPGAGSLNGHDASVANGLAPSIRARRRCAVGKLLTGLDSPVTAIGAHRWNPAAIMCVPRGWRADYRRCRERDRRVTVGDMTARNGPSTGRPRINIYQDLRARNQRRAELARLRDSRTRPERALQAARERRFGKRG
jgi:hypothetical protein